MSDLLASDKYRVILGLGATGLSVARYLHRQKIRFVVIDTRQKPPGLTELQAIDEGISCFCGEIAEREMELINNAVQIIVSPGLDRRAEYIQAALRNGVSVVGDIALFLQEVRVPVVGITGSNGKSTVTTLIAEVIAAAGKRVCAAGNIGLPALDALAQEVDIFVLELSSFQLESVGSANLDVACILNLSEDHMDRYNSFADYVMAKKRIYFGARHVVYNLQDTLTQPPIVQGVARSGFGLAKPTECYERQYFFSEDTDRLCVDESTLCTASELKIFGRHNIANVLAVFAIADFLGIARECVRAAVRQFTGLEHRCQWVASVDDVTFINDSKATNVGAAVAAIEGLAARFRRIVLIAGGEGKGADFGEFGKVLDNYVYTLVLIGRDADQIAASVGPAVNVLYAISLKDAVVQSMGVSNAGDLILLSPACASFDMFSGYADRGQQFVAAVQEVTQ